jgi:hypothetical protein
MLKNKWGRFFCLALLAIVIAACGTIARAEPSFTIENGKCVEGQPCPVNVKKHGTLNAEPSTVLVYTTDGTAKEPLDYRATGVVLTFSATETLKAVLVPSIFRAGTQAVRRFNTKLIRLENSQLYDGTGYMDIAEKVDVPPPPPPVICPDGTSHPAGYVCPVTPPPPTPTVPVLVSAPVTTGQPIDGATLTTTNGVWTGALRYFISWYRDGTLKLENAPNTYLLTSTDVLSKVRPGVVACNDAGCAFSYGNEIGPIAPKVVTPPPTTEPPPITGWTQYPLATPHRGLHLTQFARAIEACAPIRSDWGPPLVVDRIYRIVGYGAAVWTDTVQRDHWSVVYPFDSTPVNYSTVLTQCLIGVYQSDTTPSIWTQP